LLHPNRRLFRGTFDSHRLVRMELELLGFERDDDCPSAEVPERYFRFQRTSDPTHILPVLRHNAWDILSLVALAAHLAYVCDGDEFPFQAGRAAEYSGDFERAVAHFETALLGPLNRGERLEALERLARCYARGSRWDDAAKCWQALIDEPHTRRITPYVELAKIAEHRLHDRAQAYVLIDTVVAMIERGLLRPGPANGETGVPALQHRRGRLAAALRRAATAS
jgi:tetratricopeptide (TPR) repeat protein